MTDDEDTNLDNDLIRIEMAQLLATEQNKERIQSHVDEQAYCDDEKLSENECLDDESQFLSDRKSCLRILLLLLLIHFNRAMEKNNLSEK